MRIMLLVETIRQGALKVDASMMFLKWERDAAGVPQALFCEGNQVFAASRSELSGALGRMYNYHWLAAVEAALATHPRLLETCSLGNSAPTAH
jgi:hypothetical protein